MSLKVLVSMTWAMLVDSDVATAWAPSGLKAMPSGSMPTGISASTLPEAISATETMASSSLAMNMRLPLGSTSRYSGSARVGMLRTTSSLVVSMTSIASSSPAQTSTSLKSGVMRMPRGRAPVLISLIGCIVVLSSTVTVLSFSLLMKSW